jgi:hypothetical protein
MSAEWRVTLDGWSRWSVTGQLSVGTSHAPSTCGTVRLEARGTSGAMETCRQMRQTCRLEAEFFSQAALFPDNGAFCISNPHLPDCPLTYANPVFLRNTGYTLEEVIGANCRFLQVCVGS